MRKEGEGQRVRHRELDHVLPCHLVAAHEVARGLQRIQDLQRLGVEGFAGGREARGVGRAVHQVDAGPGFQALDAAAEGRLRDMAQLR